MSTPDDVPEASMEEILDSIRKIIAEDEPKISGENADISLSGVAKPTNYVSRLFASKPDTKSSNTTSDATPAGSDGERAPVAGFGSAPAIHSQPPEAMGSAEPTSNDRLAGHSSPTTQSGEALLSSRADTDVSAAFGALQRAMATASPRPVEELAKDIMRPMLKAWLDENLPPLVERLVREEIQRVSGKSDES